FGRTSGGAPGCAACLGAYQSERSRDAGRRAGRWCIRWLGSRDGAHSFYASHVCVRGDLGVDSGRDGWCRGAGPPGRQPVIPLSYYLIVSAVLFAIGTAGGGGGGGARGRRGRVI